MKRKCLALPLSLLMVTGVARADRAHLADGTPIRVRLKANLTTAGAEQGNRVDFEVAQSVTVQGQVVIPDGAVAWGAVQSVKKNKELKFDIEGVRLPNLQQLKLRSIREKTTKPGKDEIKVETQMGGDVGAPRGAEFTAYLNEDANVDVAPAQPAAGSGQPASPPAPKPQPAAAPAEVKVAAPVPAPAVEAARPAPPSSAPSSAPAPPAQSAAQAVEASTRRPAQSVAPARSPGATPQPTEASAPEPPQSAAPAPAPAAPAATVDTPLPAAQDWLTATERVTVECYSEPEGADIVIDGDFVGNTPSILKVPAGEHRLEIQLSSYKRVSQALNLPVGSGLRTIRTSLEK